MKLRARVLTRLPATLTASGGLKVVKSNGVWTFSPAWDQLVEETTIPDAGAREMWVHNPSTDVYTRLTVQALIDNLPDGPAGVDGSLIFVQNDEPGTDEPEGSIWVDADSAELDLYQLAGGVWSDTGQDLKGEVGDTPDVFVQNSAPSTTGVPEGSLWIDADSSQNDLYQLQTGSWVDTGVNLKGADGAGTGDVSSSSSFTADNRVVRTDRPTSDNKNVQLSPVTIDDSGNMSGVAVLTTTGNIELGNASDTTISRTGAGAIAVEGVGVALNSTSLPHTASQYEVGNASDTTITRSSAGVIAVEGVDLTANIVQNSQSTAYTAVLSDANKHILHPSSDANNRTFTIPANSSVAYPIGTTLTFINKINTVTIAITTDTLTLAGAGTTGSRSLAANGMATAIKIASTEWMISGPGLT